MVLPLRIGGDLLDEILGVLQELVLELALVFIGGIVLGQMRLVDRLRRRFDFVGNGGFARIQHRPHIAGAGST